MQNNHISAHDPARHSSHATRHFPAKSLCAVALICFFTAPHSAQAAAGDLDPRFGDGGVVQTDFSGGDDYGFGVKVQSDGKTVVVGESGVYPLFHSALTRYTKNGTLDQTFGTGGKVVAALDPGGDGSTALVFQSDGKIVTAGSVIHNNFVVAFVTARFNPDGSLDQTFGTNGSVQTTFGDSAAEGNDVVLQADGKIIVVGFTGAGSYTSLNNFALARFNADGSLDQSFGAGGKVKSASGIATSAVLQADGKIVVGGSYDTGSVHGFMLARYNPDGTLDGTFGNAGVTKTAIGSGDAFSFGIGILSDGRIVLAGYSETIQDHDFTLACYNSNGTLDQTFGTGGIAATDFSGGTDDIAYALAVQRDNKIVLGGRSGDYPTFNFAVARYTSTGQLDQTFGTGGKVLTGVSNDSNGYALTIAGSKITLAGAVANSQSPFDFGVARYLGR
jgi:uncharacterized delta-60 repeat protein